jgi:hypothetical protein
MRACASSNGPTHPAEPQTSAAAGVAPQARVPVQRRLQVPNLLGALPLTYSVLCDLDCLEGPEVLQCTSTRSGRADWAARAPRRKQPPAPTGPSGNALALLRLRALNTPVRAPHPP